MPILKNQRWEIFAQEIAKGETASKAACSSVEEIFDLLARDLAGDHELTPTERDGFTKLLIEFFMAIDDYRRGCKAKPSMSAEDRERIERRRLSLASRALNGSAKSVS